MTAFFESKLQNLSADSRAKYKRVLSAFEIFRIGHGLAMKDLSPRIIDDWTYDLLRKDSPKSTIVRSLNILSSLLSTKKAASTMHSQNGVSELAAARARELARHFDKSLLPSAPLIKDSAVNACLSALQATLKASDHNAADDLLIISLLGGATPVADLIRLRKSAISEYTGVIKEILRRNISPTRDYVFDLRQSYNTPRQILQTLNADIAAKYSGILDVEDFDINLFVGSLWAALAIRCGALASEALGCVDGFPKGEDKISSSPFRGVGGSQPLYALTDFITPEAPAPEAKARWAKAVATLIARDTSHWYAMHLRRGVTFDQLQKEIATSLRPAPTLFYPCRDISRIRHGCQIIDQQPYITSTVFFRTDPSSVMPLFEKIGDIAWCYRISAAPGAPYAIIPAHEMQRFQSAIGQFTPDTDIHPLGTIPLQPGDNVILLMADFYNQPARVTRLLTTPTGRTIYRVAFTTTTGIEWAVDAAPPQLLPN